MKGAIPIPYIVAIIIAIVVIAVVSYLFFSESNLFQNVIIRKYCEAKQLEYCNKPEDERPTWPTDQRCRIFTDMPNCPSE